MSEELQDVLWRVGGPQGSGVDTAAGVFARACAIGGLHILGRREYYSNIKGRHSYYDIRVHPEPLSSHRDTVDLLTTFEEETLARHAVSVGAGGAIIYNTVDEDTAFEDMNFLDPPVQRQLAAYLGERDLPPTTAGVLADARNRGVFTFSVPYSDLVEELAAAVGVAEPVAEKAVNSIAVAVSTALLDYDAAYLKQALAKVFSGRQRIIDMNDRAVELARAYARESLEPDAYQTRLSACEDVDETRLLVNGNQAVAMGKLAAGLTFQTYYPISPATDESVWLEGHETFSLQDGDDASITVIQTEDELAAVTMASGAALTGARSATATAGPGFSLMTEGLGWAGINEVPLVVTLYQRGSPSTGMPTRTEQGDLQFALRAGHGEFPRLVIASGDTEEAFEDAVRAFNYAEKYQTVVIHMLDKNLAGVTRTMEPFDLDTVPIERGKMYVPGPEALEGEHDPADSFERFAATEDGVSVRPVMGQPGGMHWKTGGEHTSHGRVTEDPVTRETQMEKRARKLETAAAEIRKSDKFRLYGDPEAPLTVASWGSTKGGLVEAAERLAAEDIPLRVLQVRLLSPFPEAAVGRLIDEAEPLVVAEHNFSGQFADLLRQETGRRADYLIVKYNGRPMSGVELYQTLKDVHAGDAGSRVVLRNPFE